MRELTENEVQRLKRSLTAFGFTGFVAPFLFAFITDKLQVDIFAFFVAMTGLTVNKRSFARFPWTLVLLSLYPIIFIAGIFSPGVNTIRFWLVPTRHAHAPHVFYAILGVWALANAWLIFAQYRVNRG